VFNGKNITMVTYFLVVLRTWMAFIHFQCIALGHMDSYNCSLTDESWSISWCILFTLDVLQPSFCLYLLPLWYETFSPLS